MRPALVCALVLALATVSCGPSATLYTDPPFRAALPEVVEAWSALAPLRDARLADLPLDPEKRRLSLPAEGTVLIGAVLSGAERAALAADAPRLRLLFIAPPSGPGQSVIAVDRNDAWAAVAEKAVSPGAATALFPPDVTPAELDRFAGVWTKAGGGPLTELVWPVTAIPGSEPVFQWAGIAAEPLARSLAPGRVVHTDPGLDRPPSSTGLTWRIRREGLGELLWKAASEPAGTSYQIPVEAVPEPRG